MCCVSAVRVQCVRYPCTVCPLSVYCVSLPCVCPCLVCVPKRRLLSPTIPPLTSSYTIFHSGLNSSPPVLYRCPMSPFLHILPPPTSFSLYLSHTHTLTHSPSLTHTLSPSLLILSPHSSHTIFSFAPKASTPPQPSRSSSI